MIFSKTYREKKNHPWGRDSVNKHRCWGSLPRRLQLGGLVEPSETVFFEWAAGDAYHQNCLGGAWLGRGGKKGYRGGGPAPQTPGGGTARPRPRAVQTQGQPRGRIRPLPGTRQGRPRGTRSRPQTEKAPLGSRSRASPPPAASTVPCIHTAVSSSGPRPAAARDSRHSPGPPSASRRSCSARTLNGGDRGSLTEVEHPPGNEAVGAAAILPRRRFPANLDEPRDPVRSHQSGARWRSRPVVGVGRRDRRAERPHSHPRSAQAYVK